MWGTSYFLRLLLSIPPSLSVSLDLNEVESLCADIERLALPVLRYAEKAAVQKLLAKCRSVSARLSSDLTYGDVLEQVGRIEEAARSYGKSGTDLKVAKDRLVRALERMRLALVTHRDARNLP